MKDYRKMLMGAAFGGAIIWGPLDAASKQGLMELLIIAFFSANGLEHVAGAVKNGVASRISNRSRVASVRPVSAPAQATSSREGAH